MPTKYRKLAPEKRIEAEERLAWVRDGIANGEIVDGVFSKIPAGCLTVRTPDGFILGIMAGTAFVNVYHGKPAKWQNGQATAATFTWSDRLGRETPPQLQAEDHEDALKRFAACFDVEEPDPEAVEPWLTLIDAFAATIGMGVTLRLASKAFPAAIWAADSVHADLGMPKWLEDLAPRGARLAATHLGTPNAHAWLVKSRVATSAIDPGITGHERLELHGRMMEALLPFAPDEAKAEACAAAIFAYRDARCERGW